MCKSFVTQTLNKTLTAPGIMDIIDYSYYPWGNAYYNTSECGTPSYDKSVGMFCWLKRCGGASRDADCFTGKVLCQHGEVECRVNKIEACALHLNVDDVKSTTEFVYCMEAKEGIEYKACADSAGLDADEIKKCLESEDGDKANVIMAMATAVLQPPHLGTPWVIVNGTQLNNPDDLLKTICDVYNGPQKPEACA